MTERDLRDLINGMAPVLVKQTDLAITRAIAPLLERVAALELRPALEHRGAWTEGEAYGPGSLVSYGRGTWLAGRVTAARPGGPDSGWRLIATTGGAR